MPALQSTTSSSTVGLGVHQKHCGLEEILMNPHYNMRSTEVAMVPYQHSDGSRRMRLKADSDGEVSFIQNVLRALNTFVAGSYFPAVNTFRMDCERYNISSFCPFRISFPTPNHSNFIDTLYHSN